MKPLEKILLLKTLPNPEELQGFLPAMNMLGMKQALENDSSLGDKIADMTLLAILMGTVHMLMTQNPDWDQYVDPSNIVQSAEEMLSSEPPEPCGDPECEGCAELEKAIAHAKETGATLRVMRLSKEQAITMGLDPDSAVGADHKMGKKKKPNLSIVPSSDTKH